MIYFQKIFGILVSLCGSSLPYALSPIQRLNAMRELKVNNQNSDLFILLILLGMLIVFSVILTASIINSLKQIKTGGRTFQTLSENCGLIEKERKLLAEIAKTAGLHHYIHRIFNSPAAFDHGSAKLLGRCITNHGPNACTILRNEILHIREKLEFKGKMPNFNAPGSKKMSSCNIPQARKLFIIGLDKAYKGQIECIVVKNSAVELRLEVVSKAVRINPRKRLMVRYYFGASVWEFDTLLLGVSDRTIIISHSDRIRFVNRRRFVRTPVNNHAFIAAFPFSCNPGTAVAANHAGGSIASPGGPVVVWGPPEFLPATITELAGPGLKVNTSLNFEPGQRALIKFIVENEDGGSAVLIQDLCIVKGISRIEKGFCAALEMIGLSDDDVDMLVSVSEAVAVKLASDGSKSAVLNRAETAEVLSGA